MKVVGIRRRVFDHQSTPAQYIEEVVEVDEYVQVERLIYLHVLVYCQHYVVNYRVNVKMGV